MLSTVQLKSRSGSFQTHKIQGKYWMIISCVMWYCHIIACSAGFYLKANSKLQKQKNQIVCVFFGGRSFSFKVLATLLATLLSNKLFKLWFGAVSKQCSGARLEIKRFLYYSIVSPICTLEFYSIVSPICTLELSCSS